jgi:hypothetical protein
MVSGSSDSKVVYVCPKHGACLFRRVVDDHELSVYLRHDGLLVLEIRFLIFGGYLLVYSYGVRVPKKLLKFDFGANERNTEYGC